MTRYEKIIEIMNEISTSDNFQSLMSTIMDSAKEIVNSEGASLLLLDAETDELILDMVLSSKGEIIQGKRIKKGAGIAGEVAATGQPLVINDAPSDKRFFSDIDKASGFITKSIAAVPVINKNKLIGVLEAVNARSSQGFSEDDILFLRYMADAAAVSIHNHDLMKNLRNRVDELTCIYEISQSIYFSLDPDELLRRVLDAIRIVIHAERCSFVIVDDEKKKALHFVSTSGQVPSGEIDLESGLISHVLKSGDPLLVYNLDEVKFLSRLSDSRYQSKSFICIPMKIRDRVIGVLNVTDKACSEIFDSFDLRVLSTISQQVAEMYENMRLHTADSERKRIERDLSIAAEIQIKAMPLIPDHIDGLSVGAFIHPARYVGGDFYEFAMYDSRYILAGLGDISGKGIPAAIFMSSVRNALRVESMRTRDLISVFEGANNQIFLDSLSGMFCTCFLTLVDRVDNTLTYVSAGHNAQLFYDAGSDSFIEMSRTGRALGISGGSTYTSVKRSYSENDIIILFSDGLFEHGAECELSLEDIQKTVRDHRDESARAISDRIKARVSENEGVKEAADDSTLMVIRFGKQNNSVITSC